MVGSTSFDHRLVRYEEVHAIQPDDFRAFVTAADIRSQTRILDCGCGYGAVTREFLLATEGRRIRGETELFIDLIDESTVQLNRARNELRAWQTAHGVKLTFIEGLFPDDLPHLNVYNIIACKMVLHEVNRDSQLRFLQGAHNFLANDGRLLLWEICLSPEIADFFRNVVRLKDQLSGYQTMVQRRNFLTERELYTLFSKSAFGRVELARDFFYRFDTRKRFMPEFGGNEDKFAEWHAFIRSAATELPESTLANIHYIDDGTTIGFDIRKVIAVATRTGALKPESELASARIVN